MRKCGAIARAVLESLEQRRLMAGVIINEFLANNNSGIVDQDNDHSDWIEIRNTDATSVNLAGWYLTDDAAVPTKWQFPSTTLAGNAYLLVYASGKNRAVAGQQLHTNFQLDGDNGEYLALVKPGGTIIADSFAPFPPQDPDISYGRGASGITTDNLIDEDAPVKVKVPTVASAIDSTWRGLSFVPDGTWLSGITGVGYDLEPDYVPYIGLDVETPMYNKNPTAYIRQTFNVSDAGALTSLKLRMRYEDGFVAYLNGTEIARRNAPAGTPAWNATSSTGRADSAAVVYEDIDVSAALTSMVSGTNVLAIHGLNNAKDSSDFLISPLLLADRSVGSGTGFFMATPTPGTANTVGTLGFVADTNFSVDRGFYDAPISVAITTATAGAQIRYTLDGTAPTATTGLIYSSPIAISTTKTLRAAAFKTGWTPTDVDTQTYIFLNDVIHQSGTGLPAYTNWGSGGVPDWEMDPTIVNNAAYSGTIKNDLKAVPTMSLVMPWTDWFGPSGIYIDGSGVERAGSVEMITANNANEFQSDAALEIQGASSTVRWNLDKLSVKVTFKAPFGPTKLNAPLFTNPAYDQGAAVKFDSFVLDSVYDESWMASSGTQRDRAKFVQDQVTADLQNAAGGHGPHGTYTHLYLNGLYWGVYYLHEIPDDSFAEQYLGGDREDYDVIKHNGSTVVAGDSTASSNYSALMTLVGKDMTVLANYNAVAAKLEIDEFIDYLMINQYTGNSDWASHNWYASFNRVDPNGKWRFHTWDAEYSFRDVTNDLTLKNDSNAPTGIHNKLMASPEYKQRFNDHVQKMLRNGGLLTPTAAAAVYMGRVNQVDRAMVGESARWGDNHDDGVDTHTYAEWRATQDGMATNFFNIRTNTILSQYTSRSWLISLAAPNLSQNGGTVSPGYQLVITKPTGSPASSAIYYTLDGTDPRLNGGGLNSTAVPYSSAITLNVAKRVKARIKDGTNWSPLIDVTFVMPTTFPLRISEIHYHPANHSGVVDPDDIEFIELVNTSASTINLNGVQITGAIDPYSFGSINLNAGQRIVVPHKVATFDFVYGTGINRTATGYGGKLDNSGEAITLLGPVGETLQTFTFGDASPWPTTPDGEGPSLEITNALGDPSDPTNWHASVVDGGTPGIVAQPPVVLSSGFGSPGADAITVQFDHDMDSSSFVPADIDVQLLPGGPIIHPTSISFSNSKTALFTFSTPLASGNYHATLLAGSVKDTAGAAITAAHEIDFFALNADANHDRHVDAADQAILTAHLGQAGTFATGDFDRNGTVNSADQSILNTNFHIWLPAPGSLALPASTGDDAYRLRRETASMVQAFAGADATATYRIMLANVTSLSFAGGLGNDTLTFDGSNGAPLGALALNFDGGNSGTDVLNVLGSTGADTVIFSSTAVTFGSTVTVSGVETRTFTGGGGGDDLTINGGVVALTATELFAALQVSPGATLDVRNFGFARNYSGTSPLATLEQNVQLGRGDGTWGGAGIITSLNAAKLPSMLTTVGLAEASNVVNFNGNTTALWQGVAVDQTTVLVRYTFAGDATLNRVIDGDDFFLVDSHITPGPITYAFGDFNHDNRVDGDDYFLIDSNYNKGGIALGGDVLPAEPLAEQVSLRVELRSDLFAATPATPAHKRLVDELTSSENQTLI